MEESNNDETITKLKACRKATNTPEAPYNYTHGVLAWVTYDGYVLSLEEILHRETTTFIIISFMNMFLWGDVWIQYYQRIMALCFDVICGILLRLLNIIKLGLLPLQYMYAWCKLMHCMALDKFHGSGHVRLICLPDPIFGIVNPLLPKFKGVLNSCQTRNEQVYKILYLYICFLKCMFDHLLDARTFMGQKIESIESIMACTKRRLYIFLLFFNSGIFKS